MVEQLSSWPQESILHSKIKFDAMNPRFQREFEERKGISQNELNNLLVRDFDVIELAEQMKIDGFHNSDPLIVIESARGAFTVLDGNRRLAAFRYACKQNWLDESNSLPVVIAPSREEADRVIIVKHINSLKKTWTTPNQLNKLREIVNRSRKVTISQIVEKYSSLGTEVVVKRRLLDLEIYDLLRNSSWLNENEKLSLAKRGINMIHRFYTSPDGQRYFAIELKNMKYPFDRRYLRGVINQEPSRTIVKEYILDSVRVPAQISKSGIANIFKKISPGRDGKSKQVLPRGKKSTDRHHLIPDNCEIRVTHPRVSDIYTELHILRVNSFPNAVASLFRIFMELSLDYYIEKKGLSSSKKGKKGQGTLTISQKISLVADYMEDNSIATKNDLKNIRRIGSSSGQNYMSVDVFHEYVHSLQTVPESSDMKQKWSNLENFFKLLWDDVS